MTDANELTAHCEERLREFLQLSAVARSFDVAIGLVSDSQTHWIVGNQGCSCSQDQGFSSPCPEVSKSAEREIEQAKFSWGRQRGKVILCYPRPSRPLVPALVQLIQLNLERSELESELTALRKELGTSWESLDTLYQVSSQFRLAEDPQKLLDLIVGRAGTLREGLRAILWLINEPGFTPAVCLNVETPAVRAKPAGLAGKAIAQRVSFTLNGRPRIAAAPDLEPELRDARAVIAAPVAIREEVFGALVVWLTGGEEEFDSSVTRLIEALAMQAALVLENDRLQREFLNADRRRKELEISSSIQEMLLSGKPLRELGEIRIATLTVPSETVDGDFYDFIQHGTDCFDVIIGDVMGKGVPAALVAAAIKSTLLHAFIGCRTPENGGVPEPREVVTTAHKEITKQLINLSSFATLCYGRFHLSFRRLDYVSCGHTSTIHVQASTGTSRELRGENLPLGIIEGEVYEQRSVDFEPGDLVFFYSDGVTETRNEQGECFGEERLAACLTAAHQSEPEDTIAAVRRRLIQYSGSERFSDDLTCIAVSIGTGCGTVRAFHRKAAFRTDLSELGAIRRWTRESCKKSTRLIADEEALSHLDLAVTEAASNIILHAHPDGPASSIHLSTEELDDGILLDFSYHGQPFDPKQVKPPEFDGSRDRGFGVFIISQTVDEVSYFQEHDGLNHIKLVKRLATRAQGETRE